MELLNFVIAFFVFIIGLCIGSFLNVVILRALSGESIVFPPSKCPKCQNRLKWWHNIPLISYMLLKGRCAFCHEKISIQYPVIEFLTGYLFLTLYLKFGLTFNTLFLSIVISIFIVISAIDIKKHIAFDLHSYILAFIGLLFNFFNFGNLYSGQTYIFNNSFIASILGLLLGAAIIGLYFGLGYIFFKTPIIGVGDIYIAGAIGACFGWKYIGLIILLAFLIQAIIYIPIFFVKLFNKKDFKTILLLSTFCIFTGLCFFYTNILRLPANILYWLFVTVLSINGFWLCTRIIKSLPKNLSELNQELMDNTMNDEIPDLSDAGTSEIYHLPFGPALCGSGLIFIFLVL